MKFINMKAAYPCRYKIKEEGQDDRVVTLHDEGGTTSVGTVLSADTLNAAFADKMDKINIGEGVEEKNSVISMKYPYVPVFCDNVKADEDCKTSDGLDVYEVSENEWKISKKAGAAVESGRKYMINLDCKEAKYSVAKIAFEASEIEKAGNGDAFIVIKFAAENDSDSVEVKINADDCSTTVGKASEENKTVFSMQRRSSDKKTDADWVVSLAKTETYIGVKYALDVIHEGKEYFGSVTVSKNQPEQAYSLKIGSENCVFGIIKNYIFD